MYAGMPSLSESERLRRLPPLDLARMRWRRMKPLTLFVHHPVGLSFPWLVNGLHIDSLIEGVGQRCMQTVVNDLSD
ncbi:MAG: hypothetical protein Ct9H300mP25_13480 [Acidobacteriota bacterium]|nr:MAG: hypothetical protein Ct9H300mP25_13480 [Acidobacteriota bacterium]